MGVRDIVKIDKEKCNGCGKCIRACAEGAIQLIDGKAVLVRDDYCDGLGACLGSCPQDAITIEKRNAAEFDEKAVEQHLASSQKSSPAPDLPCGCPGSMSKSFSQKPAAAKSVSPSADIMDNPADSQLTHWPVQLMLISPNAPYFQGADLLFAADCVPFALSDFHSRFLSGKKLVVGCPKLDDTSIYVEKLAQMLKACNLNSLTVLHMEVPCCSGITRIAKEAVSVSGVAMAFKDVTVGLQGDVLKVEVIKP